MKDAESGTKEPMGLMSEADAVWKSYSSTSDIVVRNRIAAIESVGACLSIVYFTSIGSRYPVPCNRLKTPGETSPSIGEFGCSDSNDSVGLNDVGAGAKNGASNAEYLDRGMKSDEE